MGPAAGKWIPILRRRLDAAGDAVRQAAFFRDAGGLDKRTVTSHARRGVKMTLH